MAETMVARLALEPGEKILLVVHPGKFEELVPPLRYAVVRQGGLDLGALQVHALPLPGEWQPGLLERAFERTRRAYETLLESVDVWILMPGVSPVDPLYAAVQDRLRRGQGRAIHFHWAEGSAFPLPGQPLPPAHVVDATYQAALLQADYEAIQQIQNEFERDLRRGQVRVQSPLGTDLRFRVGDRPVNRQDGDASPRRAEKAVVLIDREIELPCGALRVAPLESSVEGVVVFPPSQWNGRPVEGLEFRFEGGHVVEVTASSGREFVLAELERGGEAARSFREFALGFNPLLAVPERAPWIPYYGYGAGVVRLSLGNNSELGGQVRGSYVRWNFFTDTTVTVAGRTWVRDGRLVIP